MEHDNELKALAWLYQQYSEILDSMPSYVGDIIDPLPKWFHSDAESPLSDMMAMANKKAKEILKK